MSLESSSSSDVSTNGRQAAETVVSAGRTGWIASLILLVGVAVQLSRICQVESTKGDMPFLSANDRSRWCTIATLVIQGTYEIDDIIFVDPDAPESRSRKKTPWYSIDMVRHQGEDGKQHYYSSKPPLLPTLYAGAYWALRGATGWTLSATPFITVRTMLVLVNLLPLAAFWWFTMRWLRREQLNDWALGVSACMLAFGTFLSTFCNTLNNHLPAAICVGVSLWCIDRIVLKGDERSRWFVLCGLCTSFAAANELPALAWVAAAGAILFLVYPVKASLAYVPALLPVAAAFFGANYVAHGTVVPAYAHRDAGEQLFEFDYAGGKPTLPVVVAGLEENRVACSREARLREARRPDTLEYLDTTNSTHYAIKTSVDGKLTVHEWGDWYDYPGTYWAAAKQGVDKGEPDRWRYVFHSLLGHHGVFSLTPFWFLSVAGIVTIWRQRTTWNFFRDHRLMIMLAIVATSAVVFAFYFARGLEDRNYGGVTSGFRWTFWLIPLWFWLSASAINSMTSRWPQRVVEMLVAASVFSASYPWKNPWTSPWIMQLGEAVGWFTV